MPSSEREEDFEAMSQHDVERALGKLVTDEEFREKFFEDPEQASLQVGLTLSREELDGLLRTPRTIFKKLAGCIDGRICRLRPPAARKDAAR
jgi:hypothetical protein